MIKVVLKEESIEVSGHADYAEYGKDIVCASVSSIITTTINAIALIDQNSIYFEDDSSKMIIKRINDNEITIKLLDNMINMLKELALDYKKNISVIEMRDNK